jgi:hypothetical protein
MPTSREVDPVVRAGVFSRGGAGELPGEPAPPSGIPENVPDDLRRQLPDSVVDELLAGGRTEEEIVGPAGTPASPGDSEDERGRAARPLRVH